MCALHVGGGEVRLDGLHGKAERGVKCATVGIGDMQVVASRTQVIETCICASTVVPIVSIYRHTAYGKYRGRAVARCRASRCLCTRENHAQQGRVSNLHGGGATHALPLVRNNYYLVAGAHVVPKSRGWPPYPTVDKRTHTSGDHYAHLAVAYAVAAHAEPVVVAHQLGIDGEWRLTHGSCAHIHRPGAFLRLGACPSPCCWQTAHKKPRTTCVYSRAGLAWLKWPRQAHYRTPRYQAGIPVCHLQHTCAQHVAVGGQCSSFQRKSGRIIQHQVAAHGPCAATRKVQVAP